jgi:electron transfer flavoprotein alpha subunit
LLVAFAPSECRPLSAFGAALGLPADILLLTGDSRESVAAERGLLARWPDIPPADGAASAIASLVDGYSHIAAITSMMAKDVMARLAGLRDASMVTDLVEVVSPTVFRRPVLAGSIVATVEVLHLPVVLTVRPAGFSSAGPGPTPSWEAVSLPRDSVAQRVGKSEGGGTRPDLTQAKVVVSGGRPLKNPETFERLIGGLADVLGGAAGATRAAVDSGIAPNDLQVGQTGKSVAPDLYIAAGISGATQHLAGIKDSKVIVAINTDPQAPIFEVADLGLVADLYEVLPTMIAKLR